MGSPEQAEPDCGMAMGQPDCDCAQSQIGFPVQYDPAGPGRQSVHSQVVPGSQVHHFPFSAQLASIAAANEAGQLVALTDGQSVGETPAICHCPSWHVA